MAIVCYSGVPGAGKSYALVEQVIIPAVMAGRRVLTNIEGVKDAAVQAYCVEKKGCDPDKVGSVQTFDGAKALEPGFFPTESISDEHTVLKAGDYLVFDEWRLYWERRGKQPNPELEPFLRWHRHLVAHNGQSTDVAIGTQLVSDVSQDFRGLIERSYKFRKLKALGQPKRFAWDVFEGHLQPKGGHYQQGLGTYKPEVFALYKSYSAQGDAFENNNDKRASLFSRSFITIGLVTAVAMCLGVWGAYRFFFGGALKVGGKEMVTAPADGTAPVSGASPRGATPAARPKPAYRIVGYVSGVGGTRVVVLSSDGGTRVLSPDEFNFDAGRPVSGTVDGDPAIAVDRVEGIGAGQTTPIPFGDRPQ